MNTVFPARAEGLEVEEKGMMRRVKFNPEVTLGHLLQIGGFLALAVTTWIAIDRRVTGLEIRQSYVEIRLEKIENVTRLGIENQNDIVKILKNQMKTP